MEAPVRFWELLIRMRSLMPIRLLAGQGRARVKLAGLKQVGEEKADLADLRNSLWGLDFPPVISSGMAWGP